MTRWRNAKACLWGMGAPVPRGLCKLLPRNQRHLLLKLQLDPKPVLFCFLYDLLYYYLGFIIDWHRKYCQIYQITMEPLHFIVNYYLFMVLLFHTYLLQQTYLYFKMLISIVLMYILYFKYVSTPEQYIMHCKLSHIYTECYYLNPLFIYIYKPSPSESPFSLIDITVDFSWIIITVIMSKYRLSLYCLI